MILIKGNAVFLEFPNDYQIEYIGDFHRQAAQSDQLTPFDNNRKQLFSFTFADLIKHMAAHFDGVKIPDDSTEVITPVEPTVEIKTEEVKAPTTEVKADGQEAKK